MNKEIVKERMVWRVNRKYLIITLVYCMMSMMLYGCRYCPLDDFPIQIGTDSSVIDSIIKVLNVENSFSYLGYRTFCRKILSQDAVFKYLSEPNLKDSLGYIYVAVFFDEGKVSMVKYAFIGSKSMEKAINDILRLYEIMVAKLGIPSISNYTEYKESRIFFLDDATQSLAVWNCGNTSVVLTLTYPYASLSKPACGIPFVYTPIIRIINKDKWSLFSD